MRMEREAGSLGFFNGEEKPGSRVEAWNETRRETLLRRNVTEKSSTTWKTVGICKGIERENATSRVDSRFFQSF